MGVHDGHRERLKAQFIESGLDSFTDIQALELLLFFVIPRIDTNPIAHELLNRFGSLSGVFSASYEELKDVPGIGSNAATMISLFPELMRKCEIDRTKKTRMLLSSTEAGLYMIPRFYSLSEERMFAVAVDGKRRIMAEAFLAEGSNTEVSVTHRKIIEFALKTNAVDLLISHNHPSGPLYPSEADLIFTRGLQEALRTIGVGLCDHIIVGEDGYYSFADHDQLL